MMYQKTLLCFVFFFGLGYSSIIHASDFTRVQKLLENKDTQRAYEILSTDEDHHLGEPEYDVLLGRAALESGHFHEAIFAYERALLIQPNNINARLGLAIAHFRINENERAKELFNTALQQNPPEKYRKIIRQFIDQILARQASLRHKWNASLSLRKGVDSNINSATDNTTFELFGTTVTLNDSSRATEDTYNEMLGELGYRYKFTNNHELFGSIKLNKRGNQHKNFDTENTSLMLGGSLNTEYGQLKFPLTYQVLELDNQRLRELSSLAVTMTGKGHDFMTYSLQYSQMRYPHQSALNIDLLSGGLGYVISDKAKTNRYIVSLYLGDESPVNEAIRFNAKDFYGVQARWLHQLSRYHLLSVRLLHQKTDYLAANPFFSSVRNETHQSASLGWTWWLSRAFSVEASLESSKNESTVSLYDYSRDVMFCGITYRL